MLKAILNERSEADLKTIRGEILEISASEACPPGSPLSLLLHIVDGQSALLQGRAISSKRIDDEHFTITLRLINLSRSYRELLEKQLTSTDPN